MQDVQNVIHDVSDVNTNVMHDVRNVADHIRNSGDSGKNILEDVSEEIYTNGEYADYDYFNG